MNQAKLDAIADRYIGDDSPFYRRDGEQALSIDQMLRVESKRSIMSHAQRLLSDERLHRSPSRGISECRIHLPHRHGVRYDR